MKKFIILALLFAFHHSYSQKNATAVKLLDQVSETYKNRSFFIKFSYELNNTQEKIKQKEIGTVYASKEKYSLKLLNNQQIYDGKKLYAINDEDKEITISIPKTKDELLTPTKILGSYKNGYNIFLENTKTLNGKKVQMIKLVPTKKSNTKQILLAVDSNKKELVMVEETNQQNTISSITINTFTKDNIVPKSTFKIDKKYYQRKGYYITEF